MLVFTCYGMIVTTMRTQNFANWQSVRYNIISSLCTQSSCLDSSVLQTLHLAFWTLARLRFMPIYHWSFTHPIISRHAYDWVTSHPRSTYCTRNLYRYLTCITSPHLYCTFLRRSGLFSLPLSFRPTASYHRENNVVKVREYKLLISVGVCIASIRSQNIWVNKRQLFAFLCCRKWIVLLHLFADEISSVSYIVVRYLQRLQVLFLANNWNLYAVLREQLSLRVDVSLWTNCLVWTYVNVWVSLWTNCLVWTYMYVWVCFASRL